jgi:hypothetical protein
VAIKSSATEQPVSRVAEEATNNEVAEHPKKVARPVGRRPAFCTPPTYRLPEKGPGDAKWLLDGGDEFARHRRELP